MNNIVHIEKINNEELKNGIIYLGGDESLSASWHAKYHDSAWVYVGGLSNRLTEGDIVCIMSEFGEIEDVNLVRDDVTGASKGFAFLKYEDARSCVLAVDNLTGAKVLGRFVRCDHVDNYRLPKELREKEEKWEAGHAYKDKELASQYDIHSGQDLFAAPPTTQQDAGKEKENDEAIVEYEMIPETEDEKIARKQAKKERKQKKEAKRMKKAAKKAKKESSSKQSKRESRKRRRYDTSDDDDSSSVRSR
mmetsp:Transcript_33757/g.48881  ORF Transcript_33757/g.48881 Transcript_33757/m.48881 type:complete len:249 (-) Transcript_33757:121-867(-)|eukprot:CAMPEP_0116029538 /NCGR_PEP_ID=MMETSP0321-20121206/16198_1 /TAXON_ID=163516 /ORGANISM="Leptocylindrus danicus var. danicus, Strain B650" /LENGTH=248 /DNA_ID=CAMNT_0003503931 /DNA_START=141 /DNA_END=887 /DNA_ORIENTATION=+